MRPITTTRPTGKHARDDFGANAQFSSATDFIEPSRESSIALAWIVAICGCAVLVWGVGLSPSSDETRGNARTTTRMVVPPHRVDIDRADVGELALLPEVGPGLAARIVADRAVHGAFGSIDALTRVEGIGPARLEALRPKAIASTAGKRAGARGMERLDG